MVETFHKGAHVRGCGPGHLDAPVMTIKQPITAWGCAYYAHRSDLFAVLPRGSPYIWRLYRRVPGDCMMIFKHKDLDVVLAFAALHG